LQVFGALARFDQIVVILPNTDPGAAGIVRAWKKVKSDDRVRVIDNLPRADFLGLLRDCAVLVGNSSSGIIEAASFGTPVLDVGDRQLGRERGGNVLNVALDPLEIARSAARFAGGHVRFPRKNLYGGRGTSRRIADILAEVAIDEKLLRKLISY
jgi:GDP/UDP-N,N'-diacetylbacillosamine 2-epimerase (hydrolysing)